MVAVLPAIVLPLEAAVNVTLSTPAISLPVGSTFHLTAGASDTANPSATFTYLFAVRSSTAASYSVIKNFYKTNTVDWTPSTQEGNYDMQVGGAVVDRKRGVWTRDTNGHLADYGFERQLFLTQTIRW